MLMLCNLRVKIRIPVFAKSGIFQERSICLKKTIEERRRANGLTQKDLASMLGYSVSHIQRLETGESKVKANDEILLEKIFAFHEREEPISLLFDYVRIRFDTTDAIWVLENVLKIKHESLQFEDYGFYNYDKHYKIGDIVVMYSEDEKKKIGTLIELKGQGCRQFEEFLKAQERGWLEFFNLVDDLNGIVKRIDLAIDDKVGILDIPFYTKKMNDGACDTIFKRFNVISNGEIRRGEEKEKMMGNTLYIGSKSSEVYFCLYEKDYEQYVRLGISPSEVEVKNRFEIRTKNDRAEKIITEYLRRGEITSVAFDVINRYLTFVDLESGKEPKDCPINSRWQLFLGVGRGKLRLTTKPEPMTLKRTDKWLSSQVMPMLLMRLEIDEEQESNDVQEMLENAKLTERHLKLKEQYLAGVNEVLLDDS